MLIFSHFTGVASDESNLAVLKAHEMVANRLMSAVSFQVGQLETAILACKRK